MWRAAIAAAVTAVFGVWCVVGVAAQERNANRNPNPPGEAQPQPPPQDGATPVVRTFDVRYRSVPPGTPDRRVSLDLYAPKDVRHAPVMLYIHGGGWTRGDKAAVGQKARFFTERGWIFASANYRLLPDGHHPKNAEDVAAAAAWIHSHIAPHGGDPGNIFLMGHSAGAHLVALVGTDGRHLEKAEKSLAILRGVIVLDTQAFDVPQLLQQSGSDTYRTVFGPDPAVQRDASPIHHVAPEKGIPPFLIAYSSGMGARINPRRSWAAERFAEALKTARVPVEIIDASDRNHGQINQRFGDPADAKVTGKSWAFLTRHLASNDPPADRGTE